ncbi:MAG TPA: glycosyltransferase [Pirellulales bacterium]|nr:glycosyltransferase [Pirellulales bacterium]
MRPWLSVIIPTYNGERFLHEALTNVAAQHDADVEVVAIDGGSADGTRDILRRWSRHLRLVMIERPHSGDWVSSTAMGMAVAEGEYLCWLHQDDTWCKGRLAALRRQLSAEPHAAFIVHPCWYSNSRGERIGYWRCPLPRTDRLLRFDEVASPLLVQCSIATCGAIFSCEAARSIGSPDPALPYHADWDYWLRLARLGRTLYHHTPRASFRIHAASQTISRAGESDRRLAEARAILRRHLPHLAARGQDVARLEEVAAVSAEVNHALNSLVAGQAVDILGPLWRAAALGPTGWTRRLRDSRLVERCLSRLQASSGLRPLLLARLADGTRRRRPQRNAANLAHPVHADSAEHGRLGTVPRDSIAIHVAPTARAPTRVAAEMQRT